MSRQFQRLNPLQAAAYDSYESAQRGSCFEGTRAGLLSDVRSWMMDTKGQPIYILYGIAGIGKSTVAKTVAERAARDKNLGASFFFSRGEDSTKLAKSFFPTLAYQLSYYHPALTERINAVIDEDPELIGRDPLKQFDRLIAQPLQMLLNEAKHILLVIDALDECKEGDGAMILSLFAQGVPRIPQLKVFITTRPEPHITAVFKHNRDHKQFHLHDIDQSIVEADMRSYLEFRLSSDQVQAALPHLRSPIWQPTNEQMDTLVKMSGKLFVIATTAISFILDRKQVDPAKQLAVLLDGVAAGDFSRSKHTTAMDNVYMGIICAAQPNPVGNWISQFQACVGTIVLLYDPLPCDALAELIGIDIDDVISTLSNLHSLLAPGGTDQTFRVHHKSFLDFISDPDRCKGTPKFCIDPTVHHLRIAKRCLHIMNHLLTPNLCGLERNEWYMNRAQILRHIPRGVPPCLAYACTYWAYHLVVALKDGAALDSEVGALLEGFASGHLLTWLEALSIIGRVDTAYPSLDVVRTIGWQHDSPNALIAAVQSVRRWFGKGDTRGPPPGTAQELFNDGCRFIQRSSGILHSFPMQIYNSALPFAPRNTALFRTYGRLHPNSVNIISGSDAAWKPAIAVLRGHSAPVCCVAFSADSSRLASASEDHTVRLWDGRTGHDITTLKGHTGGVNSVAFSADDTRLASASSDRTIRLWDGRTAHHIATLTGHSGAVHCVTFSANGLRLASASCDQTVRLWDDRNGALITTLRGHSNSVNSVTFSPDGLTLASASDDGTVRLWDAGTSYCTAIIAGHIYGANSVAFLPDGSRLAVAFNDCAVQLSYGRTGHPINTLKGHSHFVTSVAFAADGSRLVSGSYDKTVRLWHGRTGARIAILKGHSSEVRSVTYSPNGSRVASASNDQTVWLWDGRTSLLTALSSTLNSVWNSPFSYPTTAINSPTFSPDGSKIAWALGTGTIWLQDGRSRIYIAALTGHSEPVGFMTFSGDGSRLASASTDNTVRLWDSRAARCIAILSGHSPRVNSVTFTADGSMLASAPSDRTVRLWDGRTGRCIAILEGHLDLVGSVTFSSDDSRLASASDDNTIRLWVCGTGTHIATLQGHTNRITSMKFSADNSILASASVDSTVRL